MHNATPRRPLGTKTILVGGKTIVLKASEMCTPDAVRCNGRYGRIFDEYKAHGLKIGPVSPGESGLAKDETPGARHLVSNKGRDQHAACDRKVRFRLVDAVGDVTCKRCLAKIQQMYTGMRVARVSA